MIKTIVRANKFYDSIFLMNAAQKIKDLEGINQAILVMGSDMNKTVLEEIGQLTPEAAAATPNDLIISLELESDADAAKALQCFEELVAHQSETAKDAGYVYPTLDSALASLPESNLVVISVPGEFAYREAERALKKGLHTFIFSDNVPLSEEVKLKEIAREKGLLVMGPGCGSSLINKIALGLMSAVSDGPVGIVGASGSGIQEIAVLLDHLGSGVSQAIGTGGRDLSAEVGGMTMIQGLKYLAEDEQTKVIVLVSKPPASSTTAKIFKMIEEIKKPMVINFIGGDRHEIESSGAIFASTLEDAALKAVDLLPGGHSAVREIYGQIDLAALANREKSKLGSGQKYLRGLFCGGTHSEETVFILQDMLPAIYSNLTFGKCQKLDNLNYSTAHTIIDMGAEEFTRGKPHPVIDPSILNERLLQEGHDPETAVLLFDLLLGYGAHPDPVSTISETLSTLKEEAKKEGRYLSMVASLCGSTKDPQGFYEQKKRLEDLGIIVLTSNAQAATLAGLIIS